ncbi:TPA: LicD family protein [Streptococcus suis]|uniref:LicD family protein n=1 Tax=Streptococcus suis TaxID=1307 RepID=UPI00209B591E|nr:LicD family protein [Streptococcus suis]MCO8204603.1 LicD family protein [Streptococcus suis]MCO8212903.1 LicD family protein [Streptococcus suis]MCO8230378.1 LicD family protein [Streptococcus suis]MCO8232256.1 LicD family protein [Streptococcus suis]MCO8238987.1 LicD family protein [Streptococcus suis]
MKKVNTLRELQLISIYIYKTLMEFCSKNGINVYLHGGSLIGAIRHGGYIPWDDDIDICMSRTDYEKLIALSGGKISSDCKIIDPATNPDFNGYIPVIVYEHSKMNSKQYKIPEDLKIGISVFVYDGISANPFIQKLYYARMFLLRAEHALCRADFNHVHTSIAKRFGFFFQRFYKATNVEKYKVKILKLQQKYNYETSEYVSTNADYQASKEICLKTDFESAVPLEFEGIASYTYSHFDSHLREYYGDYMQLPPVEQQEPKHGFEAWVDEDFDFEFLN